MELSTVSQFIDLLDELLWEREKLTDEQIEKYASITAKSGNVKNTPIIPNEEDLLEIYKSSLNK